jgi:hypothetical protein
MQVEAEGRIGGISFIAEDCAEPVLGYMIEARVPGVCSSRSGSRPRAG